jgi:hypothetical protein
VKDYVIALERKCSSFTFTAHEEAECPKADTVNVGNGSAPDITPAHNVGFHA